MKKYLILPLIFITLNAFAGTKAIALDMNGTLESLTLNNGHWQSEGKQALPANEYKYVFHSSSTQESVAFAVSDEGLAVACKADGSTTWHDCSPGPGEIAAGEYQSNNQPAHDGQGSFMVVGSDAKGALIAACRNPLGLWSNCSPTLNTQSFNAGAVGFANGQWMVFSSRFPVWNGQYNITSAYCYNSGGPWSKCDATIEDPNPNSMLAFQAVEYLPSEQRWVAVGMAYEHDDDVFKSYCRKTSEPRWKDCTGGIYKSNGTARLVKNSQGELLQLNGISEVTFNPYKLISHRSQALCRMPNGVWKNCASGLEDLPMKFFFLSGATVGEKGDWLVAGYQLPDDYAPGKPPRNAAHLTATRLGNEWVVTKQTPADNQSFIRDIFTDK